MLSEAIRRKVELEWGTEDDEYLGKVERNLEKALQEHPPDVVVYNAGTDILEGDRLGGLSISPQVRPDRGGRGEAALQTQEPQDRWAALLSGMGGNSSRRNRASWPHGREACLSSLPVSRRAS